MKRSKAKQRLSEKVDYEMMYAYGWSPKQLKEYKKKQNNISSSIKKEKKRWNKAPKPYWEQ